ncbi:MAG: multidrug transporter [Candidatus Nanoarchaeia archaeon]
MTTKPEAIALVAVCTIFTSLGSLLFKLAMISFRFNLWSILMNYYLWLGIVVYGWGAVLLIFALRGGQLSVLYPIMSLTYIWALIFAFFLLKESISIPEIAGVLIILIGVSAIGKGSKVPRRIKLRG